MQNVKVVGARVLKLLYCANRLSAIGWCREGTRWATPRDEDWCPDTKDQFRLGTRNSFCEVTQLSVRGDTSVRCGDLRRWNWWRGDVGWGGTSQVLLRAVDKEPAAWQLNSHVWHVCVMQWCTEGGVWGFKPTLKFWRPSKIVPNSTWLWKLLKICEFRTPTPQDFRKKGSKILKVPRFTIVLH